MPKIAKLIKIRMYFGAGEEVTNTRGEGLVLSIGQSGKVIKQSTLKDERIREETEKIALALKKTYSKIAKNNLCCR